MKATQLFLSRLLGALSLPVLLMACVTINIYFPAAAAEKAADRIIEDVWGKQPGAGQKAPEKVPAPGDKSKSPEKSSYYIGHAQHLVAGMLDFFISSAQAAEQADINIATPAIDKLRASMRERHAALEPFYNSGAIGLTRNALIAERDLAAVPLKDRNAVKQLVAEENQDRTALYQEIAKANNHPEWEEDIRSTFAARWVENAAAGWWYQDGSGAWKQK